MFAFEIKAARKVTLGWVITLITVTLMLMALYPTFKDAMDNSGIMDSLGDAFKLLGLHADMFGTPAGYFAGLVFLYISVCASIQAIMLGMRVMHKEWRDKTCDFLFSKPKTRLSIYAAKLSATGLLLLCTTGVYFIVTVPMTMLIADTTDISIGAFGRLAIVMLLLQLVFWAIGVLAGVVFHRVKAVLPVSLGIVFAFFALRMIESSGGETTFISYLTPFCYFNTFDITFKGSFDATFVALSLVIAAACLAAGAVIYRRKDIPTV